MKLLTTYLFGILFALSVAIIGGDFARTLLAHDAAILRSINQ